MRQCYHFTIKSSLKHLADITINRRIIYPDNQCLINYKILKDDHKIHAILRFYINQCQIVINKKFMATHKVAYIHLLWCIIFKIWLPPHIQRPVRFGEDNNKIMAISLYFPTIYLYVSETSC